MQFVSHGLPLQVAQFAGRLTIRMGASEEFVRGRGVITRMFSASGSGITSRVFEASKRAALRRPLPKNVELLLRHPATSETCDTCETRTQKQQGRRFRRGAGVGP